MSREKLLLVLLTLTYSQTITCPNYQCATLPNLQCIYFNPLTLTYYTQPCTSEDSPYCPTKTSSNSTCTSSPSPTTQKSYPGETCKNGSTCISGICKDDYCQGESQGGYCTQNITANANCAPGYFCNLQGNPSTCLALFNENEQCTSDYECNYGTACYNQQVCKKLTSLKSGAQIEASECLNSYSKYCATQQCHIFPNNTAVCTEQFQSPYSVPFECKSDSACYSKRVDSIGSAGQGACVCGANSEGKAYCSLFNGDGYMKKYLDKLEEYDRFTGKNKCNIDAVMAPACMLSHWGKTNTYEFLYYQYLANNFASVYEAEKCTLKVFNSQYYVVKENYDDVSDDSSSSSYAEFLMNFGMIYLIS